MLGTGRDELPIVSQLQILWSQEGGTNIDIDLT